MTNLENQLQNPEEQWQWDLLDLLSSWKWCKIKMKKIQEEVQKVIQNKTRKIIWNKENEKRDNSLLI